jgi:hypothetical protein
MLAHLRGEREMKSPTSYAITLFGAAAMLCGAAAASAAPSLQVSLATRETGFAGNANGTIGANGGGTGGIEWLNKDGQSLTLDGTWQTFTWNVAAEPVTAFAGASANGILEGSYGTIEHIRFNNNTDFEGVVTMWIDLVQDTVDPAGPAPPTTTTLTDFEGFAETDGSGTTEVMFQEPRFSGSTLAELALTPNFGGIDNAVGFSGTSSMRFEFDFLGSADPSPPENWLRLTTFNTENLPNPVIRYDQSSVVTVRIMGIPEPSTVLLLSFPALMAACRRRRARKNGENWTGQV